MTLGERVGHMRSTRHSSERVESHEFRIGYRCPQSCGDDREMHIRIANKDVLSGVCAERSPGRAHAGELRERTLLRELGACRQRVAEFDSAIVLKNLRV